MRMSKVVLPLLLVAAAPMFADSLGVTFTPGTFYAPPGGNSDPTCVNGTLSCLLVFGTISPAASQDYFLTSIQISLTPNSPLLIQNPDFFFFNVPGLYLTTDLPYTGPILEIDVDPAAAYGTYGVNVTLQGGANPGDLNTIGSGSFQAVITPEPSTWLLLLAGVSGIGIRRRISALIR